jgi:hypothetical protein
MPRFFAMLCLQKMRNGMGRPHTGFLRTPCLAKKQWHERTDDTTARPARQQYFMKNQPKIVYWNFRPPAIRGRGRNTESGGWASVLASRLSKLQQPMSIGSDHTERTDVRCYVASPILYRRVLAD